MSDTADARYGSEAVWRGTGGETHQVAGEGRPSLTTQQGVPVADDQNTLRYQFTVDDPATWTASWTASIPMARTNDQIFEYACHEANYGLENVLKGARFRDQAPKRTK